MAKTGGTQAVGAELQAIAKALRLTERQRLFAETLAMDPERNQTAAARAAGCVTQAEVRGSKWARMDKIRAYVSVLTAKAIDQAERRTGRKVSTLADWLAFLDDVKGARIGAYLNDDGSPNIEAIRQAPAGIFRKVEGPTKISDGKVELESAVAAAAIAIRHHDAKEDRSQTQAGLVHVIEALPPETVRQIVRSMLSNGHGNGNGNGAGKVIDVKALPR